MFASLAKSDLRELARLCFEASYETDEVILNQQEDAQLMVAIVSGRARVTRDGRAIAAVGGATWSARWL